MRRQPNACLRPARASLGNSSEKWMLMSADDGLLFMQKRNARILVPRFSVRREPVVSVEGLEERVKRLRLDKIGIISGRVENVLARLVDANGVFCNAHDRLYGKEKVAIPKSQESTSPNFQHSDFSFVRVNEQIAHVTDFRSMPVDDCASPNVLGRVGKDQAGITQFLKFRIAHILLITHGILRSSVVREAARDISFISSVVRVSRLARFGRPLRGSLFALPGFGKAV
jgi:hypothetical protein